jgi:hypothetical protein
MHARILAATTLVVSVLSPHAYAQPDPVPKNGRITIPVRLTPNDYLKPASRAYLLPEYSESIPGNRVQMFLRCFMERSNLFSQPESDRREKWNAAPLKDLPFEVRDYQKDLARDMYDAARMTQVDWQLWYFLRRDGYNTMLPDAQKMRALVSVMKTRVRGQIAARDIDGAIHTLKIIFGLAQTFESHPTLIGHLIGIACATIGLEALEELIQLPGCPSLFWSLNDLPTPILSLRMGMQGERVSLGHDCEALMNASAPVAESVILKQIDNLDKLLTVESKEEKNSKAEKAIGFKATLLNRAANAEEVTAARERVVQLGMNAANVKTWSPLHVVLIDDVLQAEHYRDEVAKFIHLPYWQAKPGMDGVLAEIKQKEKKWPGLGFVPAITTVKRAQARTEQRIGYMKILEGIRLHALNNGGFLPATLAEIKLPLPLDPATGKPYEYSVEKGVATLHGENLYPGTEMLNRYYEIRISKK